MSTLGFVHTRLAYNEKVPNVGHGLPVKHEKMEEVESPTQTQPILDVQRTTLPDSTNKRISNNHEIFETSRRTVPSPNIPFARGLRCSARIYLLLAFAFVREGLHRSIWPPSRLLVARRRYCV